jgi:hypothetical protein
VRTRAFAREQVVQHIQYCLDELLAEFEARIRMSSSAKALAQLDAREARGEPVEAVDPRLLRQKIQTDIDNLPESRARRLLLEMRDVLACPPLKAQIHSEATLPAASLPSISPAIPRARTTPPPLPQLLLVAPAEPPEAEIEESPARTPISLASRLDAVSAEPSGEPSRETRPRLKSFGQRLAEATAACLAAMGIAFAVWSAAQQAVAERWPADHGTIERH